MRKLRFTLLALLTISFLLISQGIWQGASIVQAGDSPGIKLDSSSTEPSLSTRTTSSRVPDPNDTYYYRQWALELIRASGAWQIEAPGKSGILVAVLDTGIDRNHEDLTDKIDSEISFIRNSPPEDLNGHGTHVAGIIAANTDNGKGIASIAPRSRLINVKVADDQGRCTASTIAQGILYAANHGARVINMSLQLGSGSPELEEAVDYAWQKGILLVAAASDQTVKPVYPACYKNCLAVVATDRKDEIGPLTDYEYWVKVAAPGIDIFSTLPGNSYGYKSGTSFAAAYVSGLAAVLFETNLDKNNDGKINDEIRAAIENGARKISNTDIRRIDVTNSLEF